MNDDFTGIVEGVKRCGRGPSSESALAYTAIVKKPSLDTSQVRSAAVGIGMTLQDKVVNQEETDSEEIQYCIVRVNSPQSDRR